MIEEMTITNELDVRNPETLRKGATVTKSAFRAYGTRVLVDATCNFKPKSDIVMPDTADPTGPVARGTIISCGPGAMAPGGSWDYPSVKVGDEILFEKHRSFKLKECGEYVFCLWMQDILAVLRDEDFKPRQSDLGTI